MKVFSVLLIIVFSLTTNTFSQVEFTPHIITTSAIGAKSVYAIDVDGDGDMDVLSASGNKTNWYENDGNENFISHLISSSGAYSVYATDVDGDGDIDVLSSGVLWYENDGNQNFTPHSVSADGGQSIFAVDVDSDGDMDVLSASGNKTNWYENDGNENFTTHTIATSASDAISVYAIDVDGDSDMDVLSSSANDFYNKIAWHENDGNENFTTHTITTDVHDTYSVYAIDVDGDGDIDVLSASFGDQAGFSGKIAWYENDGNENFTSHIIKNADGFVSVYSVDVDDDGDMDVLSASYIDNKIAWYENGGNENFTPHTITTGAVRAVSVYAVDLDGDGDMDVLSASWYDNKIAWYENLSPPIPVELTSFTASTSKGKVTLNWTTATETNNSGFEVQRKLENTAWEKIGFVEGHGTTTEPKEYSYVDDINDIKTISLSYRLKQIDYDGSYEYSDVVEVINPAPTDYALHQNFPNPFNPVTTISYSLPVKSQVELIIYNTLGESVRHLVSGEKEAGRYEVKFNATNFPSGIYFYTLQSGNFVETKKMILLK